MALKGLIGKLTGQTDRQGWQPDKGPFPRLWYLDAEALAPWRGKGGVLALWHRGVRPQWIFVGHTGDLQALIGAAQSDPDMAKYDRNDGVYAAWADVPQASRCGVVVHLKAILEPAVTESPLNDFGPIASDTKPIDFPPPVD